MRRIVWWLASTVTVVVLLFGYHTSTDDISATKAPSSASSPAGGGTSTSDPAANPASPAPSSSPSSTSSPSPSTSPTGAISAAKTYDGTVASTRWGPVQVQISVTAGKITTVTVLQQPSGNPRDNEINDYALPVLVQDTLAAQSADIDMVSGATVTSAGYLQSLQATLDEAGL